MKKVNRNIECKFCWHLPAFAGFSPDSDFRGDFDWGASEPCPHLALANAAAACNSQMPLICADPSRTSSRESLPNENYWRWALTGLTYPDLSRSIPVTWGNSLAWSASKRPSLDKLHSMECKYISPDKLRSGSRVITIAGLRIQNIYFSQPQPRLPD